MTEPTTYRPGDPRIIRDAPTYVQSESRLSLPRRVWELPLAILLWTYIILGIVFFLLLLVGGIGLSA